MTSLITVNITLSGEFYIYRSVKGIVLPVYKHQVISKQSTLGLWPKHTDKTAGVQTLIHVECMSQLVYSLHRV